MNKLLQSRAFWLWPLALAMLLGAQALADWPKKRQTPRSDLADIMKEPVVYLNREVVFRCRFAATGKLFKQTHVYFNPYDYINFAVWPQDARLWNAEDRRNALPTLYLAKHLLRDVRELGQADRYGLFEIHGEVVSDYSGLPWINVTRLTHLPAGDDRMADAAVTRLQFAFEEFAATRYETAARAIEEAMASGVPLAHRPELHLKAGDAWRRAGRPTRAAPHYVRASEADPRNIELQLSLAELSLSLGDAKQALAYLTLAGRHTSDIGPVYALMGEAYGRMGQYVKGLECLDAAAKIPAIHPRDAALIDVRRARVLTNAERYADAVRAYLKSINERSPIAGESWLRKEIGQFYEDRYDETRDAKLLADAIEQYRAALDFSNNGDVEALYRVGRAETKRIQAEGGKDFAAVREAAEKGALDTPGYAPLRALMGLSYALTGDERDAEIVFNEILDTHQDNAEGLTALAECYDLLGQDAMAGSLYARLAAMEPWNRKAVARAEVWNAARNRGPAPLPVEPPAATPMPLEPASYPATVFDHEQPAAATEATTFTRAPRLDPTPLPGLFDESAPVAAPAPVTMPAPQQDIRLLPPVPVPSAATVPGESASRGEPSTAFVMPRPAGTVTPAPAAHDAATLGYSYVPPPAQVWSAEEARASSASYRPSAAGQPRTVQQWYYLEDAEPVSAMQPAAGGAVQRAEVRNLPNNAAQLPPPRRRP